jgi:Raf kinase inhibitor-like YbhB/YbcL family protein
MGALVVAGCGGGKKIPSSITVTSPDFGKDKPIPKEYTCDGPGTSPPIQWSKLPDGASSFSLVVDDLDSKNGNFVHWIVSGLEDTRTAIAPVEMLTNARTGKATNGTAAYVPICPPIGDKAHRYRFTIYANNGQPLPTLEDITQSAVAKGELIAKYQRPKR